MSILRDLNGIREELTREIGNFEIIANNENKELLIKNWETDYYRVYISRYDRITVEDVSWIVYGVLKKKKKQKYINDSMRKRNGH